MTQPSAFQEFPLFSLEGVRVGSVELPCTPRAPIVIKCGAHFYARPSAEARYFRVECYEVPERDVYEHQEGQPPALSDRWNK